MEIKDKSLMDTLKSIKARTTEEEFKEVMLMVTQDIKFNRIGFNKLTKEEEVIEICETSFNLLRKDEVMWKKICSSCGYVSWSLKYNSSCIKCGGNVKCTPTS